MASLLIIKVESLKVVDGMKSLYLGVNEEIATLSFSWNKVDKAISVIKNPLVVKLRSLASNLNPNFQIHYLELLKPMTPS